MMDDIELTKIINNLQWEVDLKKGTVKSVLIHYIIVKGSDYIDLKSIWISPDMPFVQTVINDIQCKAVEAYKSKEKELTEGME